MPSNQWVVDLDKIELHEARAALLVSKMRMADANLPNIALVLTKLDEALGKAEKVVPPGETP